MIERWGRRLFHVAKQFIAILLMLYAFSIVYTLSLYYIPIEVYYRQYRNHAMMKNMLLAQVKHIYSYKMSIKSIIAQSSFSLQDKLIKLCILGHMNYLKYYRELVIGTVGYILLGYLPGKSLYKLVRAEYFYALYSCLTCE